MTKQERYEWLKKRKRKLKQQIASRQNALDKLRMKMHSINEEINEYESVMGRKEVER